MKGNPHDNPGELTVLESVRCLGCGIVYSKPVRGGTVSANPGCPSCGYVGWMSVTIPANGARFRSVVGLPRHRHAQSG